MPTEWTFVFADLAGFTALTEAHGDEDAAEAAARFYELTRGCLAPGVELVKTIGDAVMLASSDPWPAVETALKISERVATRPLFPEVRIGIHMGQAVQRDNDFFGAAVNLAARVASQARGGQVLCTRDVALAVSARLTPTPLGEARFKNVSTPVEVFALSMAAARPSTCPVCRMALSSDKAAAATTHRGIAILFCSTACSARFTATPDAFTP